jgi:glycosyltransferase involved in cell wall biosynthesis
MALELGRAGHEVVHVAASAGADAGAARVGDAYTVVRVPALNVLESRWEVPVPVPSPAAAAVLGREIRRADVVHAHGFLYPASLGALLGAAALRARAPVRVLTEHVGHVPYPSPLLDRVERGAIATLGRLALRAAQAVVVYNDRVEREIGALGSGRPVHYIRNGVDTGAFRPPGPGEREAIRRELGWDERPRALLVGRLVAKKGVDLALAATATAAGGFALALVGPGDPGPLPPHAELLGTLPREQVARLYRAADLLLLPSVGEGFPVTAQEALASGLPVILRAAPDYDRFAGDAGDALLFVDGDPAALAEAAVRVGADREAAGRRTDAAVALARRRFSWPAAVEAHLALYAALGAAARRG